jgi:hypothetical protein
LRVIAIRKALLDMPLRALANRTEFDGLIRGQAQRFFAQHMLASFERTNGPFEVHMIRQRDVNRVDLRIGKQSVVTGIRPRYTSRFRCSTDSFSIARREREQRRVPRFMQGRHDTPGGYRSDAEDSPLDGVLHGDSLELEIMQR